MAQATEPAAVLRRASLATRLAAYAVSAALGIIVLVALGGTVLSWRVEQTIEQIERANLPLLTAAVWDHSPRLVGQAESLLLLPHVAGLRIDSNGPPILAGRHGADDLIRPDLPAVVCSGHARDEAVERMLTLGRTVFLAKPYRIAALRQALSTLLDQA